MTEELWNLWSLKKLVIAIPNGKGTWSNCSMLWPQTEQAIMKHNSLLLSWCFRAWRSWVYWYGLDKSECPEVAWTYFLPNLHYGFGAVQRLSWPLLMAVSSRELLASNWSESVQKLASHIWAWLIFQLLRKWFYPGNNLHHQGRFTKEAFLSVIHRKHSNPLLRPRWVNLLESKIIALHGELAGSGTYIFQWSYQDGCEDVKCQAGNCNIEYPIVMGLKSCQVSGRG